MVRVLAVLLLLALPACGVGSGVAEDAPDVAPSPAAETSAPSGSSMIPAGFPLTSGMPTDDAGHAAVPTPDGVGLRELAFCDGRRLLAGTHPRDRLVAVTSGPEYGAARELLVLRDPRTVRVLVADLRAAAEACPRASAAPGSVTLTEVSPSALAPDAVRVVHTYEQDGRPTLGAEIIHLVGLGHALLATSTYAEWDPTSNLSEAVRAEAAALGPVVAAMCAVSGNGCDPVEPPTIGPEGVGPIRLGMPVEQVEAAGGTLEDAHGQGCTTFALRLDSGELVHGVIGSSGRVTSLTVEHGRTPEGAGPGTTERGLRQLYRVGLGRDGGDWVVAVPHADRRYRFAVDDDTVASVALEVAGPPCLPAGG